MGESDFKSQLVAEICSISSRSIASARNCHLHNPSKSPFIDWYLLLRVEEDADLWAIRKQYHKLALHLHPDKNKHPKAEIAFKLVSEAYACLSDKAKRRVFDSKRCNGFCKECGRTNNKFSIDRRGRYGSMLHCVREVRERFIEEVRVIENCLKINRARGKELPTFNPSDKLVFQDQCPHYRTKVFNRAESLCNRPTGKIMRSYNPKTGNYESPIFEF